MKNNDNIFWGSIFIIAALLLLLGQLEIFNGINIFKFAIGIFFLVLSIYGFMKQNYFLGLFSLAFFAITFKSTLHINFVSNTYMLISALLASIGLTMIFPKKKVSYNSEEKKTVDFDDNDFKKSSFSHKVDEDPNDDVKSFTNFCATTKHVTSQSFNSADITCSFGGAEIFFDKAIVRDNHGVINLNVSFGGVTLIVPNDWQINNNLKAVAGGIDFEGSTSNIHTAVIDLYGDVKFGGVTVKYV